MPRERLIDGDTSFGQTPAEHARREKARLREREKKRRQRSRQAAESSFPARREVEAFTTPSGILAYRQWVPNRTALGSSPLTAKGEGFYVSLPLVSIQQS